MQILHYLELNQLVGCFQLCFVVRFSLPFWSCCQAAGHPFHLHQTETHQNLRQHPWSRAFLFQITTSLTAGICTSVQEMLLDFMAVTSTLRAQLFFFLEGGTLLVDEPNAAFNPLYWAASGKWILIVHALHLSTQPGLSAACRFSTPTYSLQLMSKIGIF